MITLGLCLIYYGIALWLYQVNGWITTGNWKPYPVNAAWEAFFGPLAIESPLVRAVLEWLLSWPLSLSLLLCGLSLLGAVVARRRVDAVRRHRQRRRWIVEQCQAMGYLPWTMSKVLSELDESVLQHKKPQGRKAG